jgi:hypothetical protein
VRPPSYLAVMPKAHGELATLPVAIKPDTLQDANGDDQYLAAVQAFGDTTDANTQLRALAHNSVTARQVQDADSVRHKAIDLGRHYV